MTWNLNLGTYLIFQLGTVTIIGSNIVGQLLTPNPMSVVTGGTTFPLADHDLILDGGTLRGSATGVAASFVTPFTNDLAVTPLQGPLATNGTGTVSLSNPTVNGTNVSYTVNVALPVNSTSVLSTNTVTQTLTITGTTRWRGTLTRPLPVPPTVALSGLTNGQTYIAPASIPLSAAVSANGHTISQVQYYNNSADLLGSSTNGPDYAVTWNVPTGASYNNSLTAIASYESGSVTSAPVSLTVLSAPIVSGQTMLSGGSFQLSFTGPTGQPFSVRGTNLVDTPVSSWPVFTNGTFNGTVNFSDPGAVGSERGFYRVTSP
jgi:hypothetical protein